MDSTILPVQLSPSLFYALQSNPCVGNTRVIIYSLSSEKDILFPFLLSPLSTVPLENPSASQDSFSNVRSPPLLMKFAAIYVATVEISRTPYDPRLSPCPPSPSSDRPTDRPDAASFRFSIHVNDVDPV